MSIELQIRVDAEQAVSTPARVEAALDKASDAADRTTAAMGKMGEAGAGAGKAVAASGEDAAAALDRTAAAAGRGKSALEELAAIASRPNLNGAAAAEALAGDQAEFERMLKESALALAHQTEVLERIRAPLQQYTADMAALDALMTKGKISAAEYDTEVDKLNRRFSTLQGPISRIGEQEAATLQRLRGPMQAYETEVQTLERLMARGAITAEEYASDLEKQAKKAGVWQGPVRQTPPATAEEAPKSSESDGGVASLERGLGTAATLIAGGGVAAATLGLAHQVSGLIDQYHELQDTWTNASNIALKFTDSMHSANQIIDEQIRLAHDLHSTEAATIELYDTVRDGTDDLNVSHEEQIRLTRTLGEEVQLAGKSLESAGGIVTRLSYEMARGSISAMELGRIMRQVPELGDLWTKSFDTDRQGLLAMVRAGKVGVEALMRPLLEEGEAIDKNFERRQRTIKQKEEEFELNEKLYSQKYDVAQGEGHGAQALVDTFKNNRELMSSVAGMSDDLGGPFGKLVELAKNAQQEVAATSKAGIQETIDNVKNLTGFLRPLGDRYREWTGDTAAVRAEILKITAPIEAAGAELSKLDKAFEIGKIGVVEYTKHWQELQTTLGHGVGPQALKLTEPIRVAREEMTRFLNEVEAGADVTQAQARKALASYQTAIRGGVTPEDLKLNNPKLDAADALKDLNRAQAEGKITAESYRREYDALVTTMNDGRLPEAIKIMEGIHDPIDQAARDFRALSALLKTGQIDLSDYVDHLKTVADTHKNASAQILTDSIEKLRTGLDSGRIGLQEYGADVRKLVADFEALHKTSSGITYRIAKQDALKFEAGDVRNADPRAKLASVTGSAEIQSGIAASQAGDLRDVTDAHRALNEQLQRELELSRQSEAPLVTYEQALKDIAGAAVHYGFSQEHVNTLQRKAQLEYNAATEALVRTKGPLEEYNLQLKHLADELEHNEITLNQYGDAVDRAKLALLDATGESKTFLGGMQEQWIKMRGEADEFGASISKLVAGDLDKLNDGLVAAANGGEVSWSAMADAMIQDLERVLLKMLEVKAITGIASLAGGSEEVAAGSALGAATGGSFMVRGIGGPDSQHVSMALTPGELVTIQTPGQYQHAAAAMAASGGGPGGGGAPVVHVHNHYDESIVHAAMESPAGQRVILNALRANPGAVRSYSGMRGG